MVGKRKTKPVIEINVDEVEKLAGQGLTDQQIACCLGISRRTLASRKKDFAQIAHAIKKGKAKGIATVTNVLFEKITKEKNISAIIFYLKSQAGWQEPQVVKQDIHVQNMDQVYKQLDEILATGKESARLENQKAEMIERQRLLQEEDYDLIKNDK
ncbi:hypothetical protein BKK51_09465 [Rodentibacter trehalosifermentans]|uniref:Helix-turn-helix domain-containing protein n=2 Tax=Rodentibacter TaxID=1960084 RepID=A0A1V3INI7_9PAST|nr:hypothetical protein BKK50_04005 [Rodentibacter rarus]OOF44228.1 hypothetical protein BKK51_09465 [Rodentibacter trehalosifermentans]